MTRMRQHVSLLLAVAFALLAAWGWHVRPGANSFIPIDVFDRVVVPPPLQVALAGGDRFLAANIEAIRALATPSDSPDAAADNVSFAIRARSAVANLHPCHEDNYYLANALLAWGGAVGHGNEVLRLATNCRLWDEFPPFYYGFNLYYFDHDVENATKAINEAANRSRTNSTTLRKLAIMLTADSLDDDAAALAYLEKERDQARDAKLRETLNKRILRLQGLISLRQAQASYEGRFGKPLTNPQDLISFGFIEKFPADPLNIGYEYSDHHFRMREIRIPGLGPSKK